MGLNQRNRIVIRCVVAAIWLLGLIIVTSTGTIQLLYLLPVLAMFSFFLVDYFSGFVIAILLTVVVTFIYPVQVPGITRALTNDAIWILAIVAAGIKLLKPFDTTSAAKRVFTQPIANDSAQELLMTIKHQTGELSVKFWHDLQTPIRLILGFCDAILRADHNHGQALPSPYRDNVQAIYRNAQQMEKMVGEFLNRLKPAPISDAEELNPAAVIQETAKLMQELMAAHGITLEVKIAESLPKLRLNRITTRQVLLNVLRIIARANGVLGVESLMTVRAKVQHSKLHISITALSTNIDRAMADVNWSLNERLLDKVGGSLSLETFADPNPDAFSNVVLIFPSRADLPTSGPLPTGITNAVDHLSVLVISEESNVIDLFTEYLSQYKVIGIKDINTLYLSPAPIQAVAVILTREQQNAHLQMISEVVGKHTPIIVCAIATAQERLQRLNAVYLPKPLDYDTLCAMLTNASPPIEHILIVDDNMDSAEMLARMLVAISPTFVSQITCLAQEALIMLDQYPVDAIILDVFLPDMDGIALVQQIRAKERFAHLPIVLFSAQQNLDFMRPVIDSDTISLFQLGGSEANRLAIYVEALVNAIASNS